MVTQSKFHTEKPQVLAALCVISGFRREVNENCALLGCYAASSGNSLATFRSNISVKSSRVKILQISWSLHMVPKGCPETSVRNYHCALRTNPEERSSYQAPSKKVRWPMRPGGPCVLLPRVCAPLRSKFISNSVFRKLSTFIHLVSNLTDSDVFFINCRFLYLHLSD